MTERKNPWPLLRDILVALLGASAAACGLFFHGSGEIVYAPALLLILASALIAVLAAGRFVLPRGAISWLLLALWGWLALGLLWTTVPFASLLTWLVFSALPLAVLAFGSNPLIVPVLLSGLTLLGGFAVLQVTLWPAIFGLRAHAPLLDPNNLAALLNLGLAPVLALLAGRGRERRLLIPAAAILFAGLLATQSRAGLGAAAVATLVVLVAMRGSIKKPLFPLALLAGAGTIFLAMFAMTNHSPASRLALAAGPNGDANLIARLAIWRGALRLILAHPWLGTGFGTFYLYYPAVRAPLLDNSTGNWAHNDLLQFWAEAGIPAALLFLCLVLAAGWRTWKALRAPAEGETRAAVAGLAAGLLAALLQAQVEFQFYVLPTLIVTGAWLTRLDYLTALEGVSIPVWRRPWGVALAAAGLALPVLMLTLSSAAGVFFFQRAQADLRGGRITAFLADTGRAEKVAPASYAEPRVMLAGFYLDIAGKPSPLFGVQERRQMLQTAGDLLATAQAANPAWGEIDRKEARLAALREPPDPAGEQAALRRAVAKDPMNFQARQDLATLLVKGGEARTAFAVLSTGLAYPHPADVTRDYTILLRQIAPYAALQKKYEPRDTVP